MNATPIPGYSPLRIFQIIWAALFTSLFLYAFVLFFVASPGWDRSNPRWMPNFQDQFEMGMAIGAVLVAFASRFLPPLIAGGAPPNPGEDSIPSGVVKSRLFPVFVMRLALSEAVCLIGFALAMRTQIPEMIFPFLAVAVVLFLKVFPGSAKKIAADLGRST